MPMIMNEVRAVDQRNLSLGNDKSETLHGSGHGSSVGTVIEPMARSYHTRPDCIRRKNYHALHRAIQRPDKRQLESLFR